MNTLRLCFAILLSSLFIISAHADETVSLKVGYASVSPSGTYSASVPGQPGSRISDNALALGKSNSAMAELALQLGDGRITVSYLPLKFKGSTTLTTTINFNGQTFVVGTPVTSVFNIDTIDVGYTYYLINMDDMPSRLQLGAEIALKALKVGGTLSGGGTTQAVSANVALPTIGIRGRIALADFIGFSVRGAFIGYQGNTLTDLDGQVEFSPIPMAGIFGGYRSVDVKVDHSGIFVNSKFAGPYAGGFLRF